MAVQSFYGNTEREVGTPAIVSYLTNWFDERKAMNDEAARLDEGPDPDKIADAELAAREELGRLQRALVEARSGSIKSTNDLAKTIIQGVTSITNTNTEAAATIGKQKMWLNAQYMQDGSREAEQINKDSAVKPEDVETLRNLAQRMAAGDQPNTATQAQFEGLARSLGGKGPGDTKYDALAAAFWKEMVAAKVPGAKVAEMSAIIQPRLEAGQTPADYFFERHHAETYDDLNKRFEKEARKYGAGGDVDAIFDAVESLGIDPKSLGLTTETFTKTRGAPDVAEGPGSAGGSVSMTTQGPGAAKFAAAVANGEDPFKALEDGIREQLAYTDRLAAERKEAELARMERRRFPRANPYTANPNTYVNARGQAAARSIAENDPGVIREEADALLRNNGNLAKAYRETGLIEPEFAAKDYLDLDFSKDGDLGSFVANVAKAASKPTTIKGSGGYTYEVSPTGEVTIVDSPTGGKGTKVAMGSPEYVAIANEVGPEVPALYFMRLVQSQPAEVQALFRPALTLLRGGDAKAAEAEARKVSAEDVRGAYGMALKRAANDPTEAGRIQAAIEVLPDIVGGQFKRAIQDAATHYGTVRTRGGKLADRQLVTSLGNLGTALLSAGESAGKVKQREHAEQAEQSALSDEEAGRRAVDAAIAQGKSIADIRAGWEKAPDSPMVRAARVRIAEEDPWGVGTTKPDKVAAEKREMVRTGMLPSVSTGEDALAVKERPIVKAPDTASVRASEEPAPSPKGLSDDDKAWLLSDEPEPKTPTPTTLSADDKAWLLE